MSRNNHDLNNLRIQIDLIDGQIVALLSERLDIAKNVAAYKKARGLEIFQPAREAEVIKNISGKINKREYKEYILKIYGEILEASKSLQNNQT